MLRIKTLSSLLLLVFLLNPVCSHTSGDDEINITPTIIQDPHPRKFLKFSSSDYKPINITFDFSNIEEDYARSARYLNETVFPPVQNFLRSALKVRPRNSKITARPGLCGDWADIPEYASKTGYDSDLVIFVKFVFSGSFVARASPCGLDETTRRPTVGFIQFRESKIYFGRDEILGLEMHIAATIHELVHVLGFNDGLYPYFINSETLERLPGHLLNKTVNGVRTLVLDLPPLTQRVRDYFNCPTAKGAYLENQGGSGSVGSHFERRIFYNEIMTASEIADTRISEFTLALLEGTGWYKVNYTFAEPMTYGKNQGCAFLNTKCIDSKTLKPHFKEFCSPLESKGVSWTLSGFGSCGSRRSPLYSDPNLTSAFDYWGNNTVVDDAYSDNCPTIMFGDQTNCNNPKYQEIYRDGNLLPYEVYGPGSKAFMGTLSLFGFPRSYNGFCFKPKCVHKPESSNYELQVNFNGRGIINCTAAGRIDASDFGFDHDIVGVFECPDPNEFCERFLSEGYCRGGCFGKGVCVERECQCEDGWGSDRCAVRKEAHQSSKCIEDSLRTTAYGDTCICSESNITCQCLLGSKYACWVLEEQKNKDTKNNNTHHNINNNNSTKNEPTNVNIQAVLLVAGLILVVLAIIFIKKNKSKSDGKEANGLDISLSKAIMSDQNNKIEPVL